jgi:hypothetical protein
VSGGGSDQAPSGAPGSATGHSEAETDGHPREREPEGGQEQEEVEDRPNVGAVKPGDYPAEQRRPL